MIFFADSFFVVLYTTCDRSIISIASAFPDVSRCGEMGALVKFRVMKWALLSPEVQILAAAIEL